MKPLWRLKDRPLLWLFVGIFLLMCVTACSPSKFEQQHKEAVLQNPPGIELEIRTNGEFYTARWSGAWRIEVLEGMNVASNPTASDVIHVTDGTALWDQPRRPWVGIVCCDSRWIWLDQEPVRIPYKLSPTPTASQPQWQTLHLPDKPGKYRVYVTTHRVFARGSDKNPFNDKGFAVSSNILDLLVK